MVLSQRDTEAWTLASRVGSQRHGRQQEKRHSQPRIIHDQIRLVRDPDHFAGEFPEELALSGNATLDLARVRPCVPFVYHMACCLRADINPGSYVTAKTPKSRLSRIIIPVIRTIVARRQALDPSDRIADVTDAEIFPQQLGDLIGQVAVRHDAI